MPWVLFGSCGLKQCCQKPFWYRIFPALCLSLRARIPGMDHWPVSQLSPGWQAPRSAPMHLVRINPGIKCGKYELGVSCGTAVTAGSSVCVCEQQTCSWLFLWIYRSEGGNQTIRGSHASILPHWAGRNTLKKI